MEVDFYCPYTMLMYTPLAYIDHTFTIMASLLLYSYLAMHLLQNPVSGVMLQKFASGWLVDWSTLTLAVPT